MKKIRLFTVMLGIMMSCIMMTSCVSTYASTQYDDVYTTVSADGSVTYTTVVTYGTPYYIDGVISYYLYNGWYYYPYLWNDIWYFRPFHTMQPRGFVYQPGWRHRPDMRLGDMRMEHQHNFGDRTYAHAHMNGGMRGGNMGMQNRGNMGMQNRGGQMQQRGTINQRGQMQQGQPQSGQMQQNGQTQQRGTVQGNTFNRSSSRITVQQNGQTQRGTVQTTPRVSTSTRSTTTMGGMRGGSIGGMRSGSMGGMRGGSAGGPAGRMGGGRR